MQEQVAIEQHPFTKLFTWCMIGAGGVYAGLSARREALTAALLGVLAVGAGWYTLKCERRTHGRPADSRPPDPSRRRGLRRFGATVAAASLLLAGSACLQETDPFPQPKAVTVVIVGMTGSDVGQRRLQEAHLTEVVIPEAVRTSARVIVGVLTDASVTRPEKIADVSFAHDPSPVLAEEVRKKGTAELMSKVRAVLDTRKPAPASDPFGAVLWSRTILDQFPKLEQKHLVLLTDSVATVEGCNLTARDLSPQFRPKVIDDCTYQHLPALPGVKIWQAGAGLSVDLPLPTATALAIEDLWREFWPMTGAELACYCSIVVGAATPA